MRKLQKIWQQTRGRWTLNYQWGKNENQLHLHHRIHKRLWNRGHRELGKGETQHKESQVCPKTPFQNLHNWATYSSSSQQKTEKVYPLDRVKPRVSELEDTKTGGLSQSCIKCWDPYSRSSFTTQRPNCQRLDFNLQSPV